MLSFYFDYGRETPVDYAQVSCPYGEELLGRGILFNMQPSFTEQDLDDIVKALNKVALHYRSG